MAGGFLGLPNNPWASSPMQALTDMTADGAATGAPSPAPAPAPAPTPEPATTGAIGGGGSQGGGVGSFVNNLFSGRGLFGGGPDDDKVDPATGVTQGQARQVNMQSMMGLGLTLMAAGMRQSDDSRAAILARAPGMLNNQDSLNGFAKMRLEMANARLKERQAANADEQARRWQSLMGGSGAAAGANPGLTGAPAALPGTIAPAGAPAGGVAAPVAAGGAPAAPMAAPGADTAAPAPTAQAGGTDLLAGISPGTRTLLGALGPEKGMEKLLDIRRGLDEQETIGDPREDPSTGKIVADKLKNGRRVGIVVIGDRPEVAGPAAIDPDTGQKRRDITRGGVPVRSEGLGDVPRPIEMETAPDGRQFQVRKDAQGRVIERTAVPEARENATDAARAKQYVEMEGSIRTAAKEGASMMKLLNEFQGAIDDDAVYFGPGADKVAGAKSIAKALGMDVNGVDQANLAQKVQNQLALRVRNPDGGFGGMPGSTSDRDVSFLLSSVPSLMSTREGAQLIKDTFADMAKRNLEIDKMRRDYVKTNGKLDARFEDMVADKYDEPLLNDERRGRMERLAKAQAGAPAASTPQTRQGPEATPQYSAEQRAAAQAELARRRAAQGR